MKDPDMQERDPLLGICSMQKPHDQDVDLPQGKHA